MTNKCFLCETNLTIKNETYEHIFLKSLGNGLGSKLILCKTCNSLLGDLIDAVISKNFDNFIKLAGIHGRKRKNQMNIEGKTAMSGLCVPIIITPNGTPKLKSPVIPKNSSKAIFNIEDGKSADKWKKSQNKKFPKANFIKENHEKNIDVCMNQEFNLKEVFLETMKMSIEFSIYCGIKKENIITLPIFRSLIEKYNHIKAIEPKEAKNIFYEELKRNSLPLPLTCSYPNSINKELKNSKANIKAALYNYNNSIYFFISFFDIIMFTFKVVDNSDNLEGPIIYLGDDRKFINKYHDIILTE